MPIANIIGVAVFFGIAVLMSEKRGAIKYGNAGRTLALQFGIACAGAGGSFWHDNLAKNHQRHHQSDPICQ